MKSFILRGIIGIAALFGVSYAGMYIGVSVGLNFISIFTALTLGIPGVGALAVISAL